MTYRRSCRKSLGRTALFLLFTLVATAAQKLPTPTRLWSIGPLTKKILSK